LIFYLKILRRPRIKPSPVNNPVLIIAHSLFGLGILRRMGLK
jgi:hypothetical protein